MTNPALSQILQPCSEFLTWVLILKLPRLRSSTLSQSESFKYRFKNPSWSLTLACLIHNIVKIPFNGSHNVIYTENRQPIEPWPLKQRQHQQEFLNQTFLRTFSQVQQKLWNQISIFLAANILGFESREGALRILFCLQNESNFSRLIHQSLPSNLWVIALTNDSAEFWNI